MMLVVNLLSDDCYPPLHTLILSLYLYFFLSLPLYLAVYEYDEDGYEAVE